MTPRAGLGYRPPVPVIEAVALRRTYRTSTGVLRRRPLDVEAVRGVSFEVARGELYGLLGPNGAGKTTTIKMLVTLLVPTSGSARVLGHDAVAAPARVRASIGYVFGGDRGLYERLSALDNLRYFAELGLRIPVPALPSIALTMLLTATTCAMFGLVVGSVGLRARDLWVGSNLVYSLMLLMCGVIVPLSLLPGWLAAVGRALPVTHGVEAARELARGADLSDVAGLLGREAMIGLAYAVVGYGLLRLFEAESRRRASLDAL